MLKPEKMKNHSIGDAATRKIILLEMLKPEKSFYVLEMLKSKKPSYWRCWNQKNHSIGDAETRKTILWEMLKPEKPFLWRCWNQKKPFHWFKSTEEKMVETNILEEGEGGKKNNIGGTSCSIKPHKLIGEKWTAQIPPLSHQNLLSWWAYSYKRGKLWRNCRALRNQKERKF